MIRLVCSALVLGGLLTPPLDIVADTPRTASGLVFVTPQDPHDLTAPHGPTIYDGGGRPVWFHPIPAGDVATNFRVVRVGGRPTLLWWQGAMDPDDHLGVGHVYVADEHYRVTMLPGSTGADLHDVLITARGTALIPRTREKPEDLRAVGGDQDGRIVGMAIDEVDLATGRVIWTWSSLDHVPLAETSARYSADDRAHHRPFDYFHFNSLDEDAAGNLLISARHTSTVYLVDHRTGNIVWRLGGRQSSFAPGPGAVFGWQHNAAFAGPGVVRLFDNTTDHSGPCRSRAVWLRLDPVGGTSRLVREVTYPRRVCSPSAGNVQDLPNGDALVGWGPAGRLSEFSPDGDLVFDATFRTGWSSYRAYRFSWSGTPATAPAAVVRDGALHAVWNGATRVARWRLSAGSGPGDLHAVSVTGWDGLDTAIPLPPGAACVRVDALDAADHVLGSSPVTPARP